MKIKIAMIIILLAIVATACMSSKNATESKPGEKIQQAEANETVPPGTILKQVTSQIKFKVIPPDDGSNVSI